MCPVLPTCFLTSYPDHIWIMPLLKTCENFPSIQGRIQEFHSGWAPFIF